MLLLWILRSLANFMKKFPDEGSSSLQLFRGSSVGCEPVMNRIPVTVAAEHHEGCDGSTSLGTIADVAELIDEGMEDLLGVLDIDWWLRRARDSHFLGYSDERGQEHDRFVELVDNAGAQRDGLFFALVQRIRDDGWNYSIVVGHCS